MKKCTLSVDRVYDDDLPENERRPACVVAWPTSAWPFGGTDVTDSELAIAIRERVGFQLTPKGGYPTR